MAKPLSMWSIGNASTFKVNFASQKRSFTYLALLGVQDDTVSVRAVDGVYV